MSAELERRVAVLEREVVHLRKWLVPLPGVVHQQPGYTDEQTLRALCGYAGADFAAVTGSARPAALAAMRRLLARQLQANGWTPARIARAMRKDRKTVEAML